MAKGQSLQDPFLNTLRKERIPVSIYLVNGIKLQGQIDSFDQFVVLLKNSVSPDGLQTRDFDRCPGAQRAHHQRRRNDDRGGRRRMMYRACRTRIVPLLEYQIVRATTRR